MWGFKFMPIYFRTTPLREPFTFDSVGNHWDQEEIRRRDGYPIYHYLQSEHGTGEIEIQGKNYLLSEGQGVFIAPGVRHCYRRKSREWFTSFATVTGLMEDFIAKLVGNHDVIFIEKNIGQEIAKLLTAVAEKFSAPPIDAKMLSTDCYQFLMYFMDGIYSGNTADESAYKKYVKPVIRRIETDFDADLTVQELCASVYITPQYLSRLFTRFVGCSTYEYLMRHRVNEAKKYLLSNPKIEIQEVARQVGFNSASHFIAIFKKKTGITPMAFREGQA